MIEFTSRYSVLLSLIFLAASFFFAFYFYRKTNLSRIKKFSVIALKTASVFILLLLFIEPSILATISINRESLSVVLIDDSRSNHLYYEKNSKNIQIKDIYGKLGIFRPDQEFLFSSSNSLKDLKYIDSLNPDGFETNVLSALENLRNRFPETIFKSVAIISDGVFNSGGTPIYIAKTFQCPFITIGIGDTAQQKDVVINKVSYNEKAFTEANVKINTEIKAYGLINEKLNISLVREGTIVSVKTANITSNNWSSDVSFDIRESEPGTVKYRVLVENKPGEITYNNNHFDFFTKYLQNKINLLCITGGPGYDNGLLTTILKRIKNHNVTIKTAKSNNDFYEGPVDFKSFGDLSVLLLLGFPTSQFNSEIISSIAQKVKTLNIPLVFFASKNTAYSKLEQFDELVPFTVSKPSAVELAVALQATDKMNESKQSLSNEVASAPALFQNTGGIIQKAGSEVSLINRNSGDPVLITRNTAKNKSTAFLAYGFWKWRLNPKIDYERLTERILLEIINMTLMKDKKSKLVVIPDKDIFDYSEDSKFTAELYDENYNNIKNGVIKAKIVSGQNIIRNDLMFTNIDNKFHLNAGRLGTGNYKIVTEADVNGSFYASDEERFACDTLNTEFKITKSNFENLQLLSQNTNGRFFSAYEDFDTVNNYVRSLTDKKQRTQISRYVHFNLWENKYMLLLAILLFSIEWVIRKRANIP